MTPVTRMSTTSTAPSTTRGRSRSQRPAQARLDGSGGPGSSVHRGELGGHCGAPPPRSWSKPGHHHHQDDEQRPG